MSWLHREFFPTCQVLVSPARLWVQGRGAASSCPSSAAQSSSASMRWLVQAALFRSSQKTGHQWDWVGGSASSCTAPLGSQLEIKAPYYTSGVRVLRRWALRGQNPANCCPDGAFFRISVLSQGTVFVPLGHSAMSRGIFGWSHPRGGNAAGIYWVGARDAATHPAMHRSASNTKRDLALDEKPCLRRAKFGVPLLQSFKQSV